MLGYSYSFFKICMLLLPQCLRFHIFAYTVEDGIVNRTICISWNSQCCFKSYSIKVKSCSSYFVYYLSSPNDFTPCSRYYTSPMGKRFTVTTSDLTKY